MLCLMLQNKIINQLPNAVPTVYITSKTYFLYKINLFHAFAILGALT